MNQLHGNLQGLSPDETKRLERLYRRRLPFNVLLTPELARSLCEVSHRTHRQVGVLVDRAGVVHWVVVGDATRLVLPDVGRLRGARGRFRGLRLIHTHLHNDPLSRDDLVDLTRLRLDLIAALCLSPEGLPQTVYYGHNLPPHGDPNEPPFTTVGPIPYGQLDVNPEAIVRGLESEYAAAVREQPVVAKDGRAILVHVCERKHTLHAEDRIRELKELARTAGVEVASTVLQVRDRVDPRLVMGRGRLDSLVVEAMQRDADVIIMDHNLTPSQASSIARLTDLRVLDRTQLILDIFAQRAQSRDGKLQVELAQMKYLLPRLGTRDDSLSRLTGGIGGRGPGETKLEIGRRRAQERITRLQQQIRKLSRQRQQQRHRRNRRNVPSIAIIGYTNAGKSTLLNALTQSDVLAEDKLFATLDTRARRFRFPREQEVVITDTVGFIRNMPAELFDSFKATFEEAQDADLLLHVVDGSDPSHNDHIRTTEELLVRLDLHEIPRVVVFNKLDLKPAHTPTPNTIPLSALRPDTFPPLLSELQSRLFPAVNHQQTA